MKYGNYLGNNYNRYPAEPIDELDYCCFLHDIDHKEAGGNNRFADMELNKRLKKVTFKNLTIKGKVFYIGARYLYSGLYAQVLRQLKVVNDYLIKNKYGKSEERELKAWLNSHYVRNRAYLDLSKVWKDGYKYNYLI